MEKGPESEQVSKLMEELRRREREIEKQEQKTSELERENTGLKECLRESEERMRENIKKLIQDCEERMKEQTAELVKSMMGMEGAARVVTSTPIKEEARVLPGARKKVIKQERVSTRDRRECREESDEEREIERREKTGKTKKVGKLRDKKRYNKNLSKSIDSLYTSSEEVRDESPGSESETEGEYRVQKSVLIREVPKIGKYNVYDSKDVGDFFKEFEEYCRERFGDKKSFWTKELGEHLEGRLGEFYRAITENGEQKYEIMKDRIIGQVKRVKVGVKYRKRSEFEEARMGRNEKVELYVHRLETLARRKFGDEGINECKELMKKFLATAPDEVVEYINVRRKEKMRWTGERLVWSDVLEIIEDMEFDKKWNEKGQNVYIGRKGEKIPPYTSYRDALMANPVEVMNKFIQEYEDKERENGRVRNGWQRKRDTGMRNPRESDKGNNFGRINERTMQRGKSAMRCFKCERKGHIAKECMWVTRACFGCGKSGHSVKDCTRPHLIKCYKCRNGGHLANQCLSREGEREKDKSCGNCGIKGHFARMCWRARSKCEKCNLEGHYTARCVSANLKYPHPKDDFLPPPPPVQGN